MKKLFACLFAVALFGTACQAFAAPREFGPDFSRFTMDIPDGWSVQEVDGGAQIASADGREVVAVVMTRNNGKSAKEIARGISERTGLGRMEKKDEVTWLLTGSIGGSPVVTAVSVDRDRFFTITLAGADMGAMKEVASSIREKHSVPMASTN